MTEGRYIHLCESSISYKLLKLTLLQNYVSNINSTVDKIKWLCTGLFLSIKSSRAESCVKWIIKS